LRESVDAGEATEQHAASEARGEQRRVGTTLPQPPRHKAHELTRSLSRSGPPYTTRLHRTRLRRNATSLHAPWHHTLRARPWGHLRLLIHHDIRLKASAADFLGLRASTAASPSGRGPRRSCVLAKATSCA